MRLVFMGVAALACAGCASGPKLPFVQSAKEAVGLDRIFQNDQQQLASAHKKRSLVSTLTPEKKPFWKKMLPSSEPRVVKSDDPVTLASKSNVPAEVHIEAARLHEQRQDLAAAAAAYGRALAIDKNNEVALLSFARLYDRSERFDEAITLYRRAVEAHPKSPRSHNDYALCLVRHGDLVAGIKELSLAVELAPEEPRYRNNIGQVLVAAGRIEDGLTHLRTVHTDAAAHYNVAHWLQTDGNLDAALSHYVRAAELDPSLSEAHSMVAQLRQQGQGPTVR